ncbi:MAG: SDR family NAD(P)-dependent oxidoreductase [Acidimicrobiales bacterium]
MSQRGMAVVTGASSGIGAATARRLAAEGFDVVVGARRIERLRELADEIEDASGGRAVARTLDVTDAASVDGFCAEVAECRVLVNNAGGAPRARTGGRGRRRAVAGDVRQQRPRALRVTQGLLPRLRAGGDGHIVNIGSIAGFEAYPGGAGYNAAKFAVRAVTQVLRMELLGEPLRVAEVDPGMVETEFSLVRFGGDEKRAGHVYEGLTPLTADDVADCVAWAVTRPGHVNIDQIVVRPRDQATATMYNRR